MKKLFLFLTMFAFLSLKSQVNNRTFGDVTVEDLQKTSYDKFDSPEAVILFDKESIEFGRRSGNRFEAIITKHVRIHILKNSGLEYGNHKEQFYIYRKEIEKSTDFQASTYNLENNNVVAKKLGNENIFDETIGNYFSIRKYLFPNVKVGSIVEYSYKFKTVYYGSLDPHYFQHKIPCLWSELEISIPNNIEFAILFQKYEPFLIEEKRPTKCNLKLLKQSSNGKYEIDDYEVDGFHYKWAVQEVEGYSNQLFVANYENFVPKIEFKLLATTDIFKKRRISDEFDWKIMDFEMINFYGFDETLDSEDGKVNYLINSAYKKSDTTQLMKAKAIYNYIKNNFIIDDAYYGCQKSQTFHEILKTKKGTIADINNLLITALNTGGIKSSPALGAIVGSGRINQLYPLIENFNFIISCTEIDGKKYFLDASSKHLAFGQVRPEFVNGLIRIFHKKNGEFYNLSPDSLAEKHIISVMHKIEGDSIHGNFAIKENPSFTYKIRKAKQNNYIDSLEKSMFLTKTIINKSDNLGENDELLNCKIKYAEEISNDSFLYLNPGEFHHIKKNYFTNAKRNFPIEFESAAEYYYSYILEIPSNYSVVEIPKSQLFSLNENNDVIFEYKCNKDNNKINIRSRLKFNKATFPSSENESFYQLYNQVLSKHKENIVLKKI